jgi:hypothetical protein
MAQPPNDEVVPEGDGLAKRKTGPLRARIQFVGEGPTITFQRGTAGSSQAARCQFHEYADAYPAHNRKRRMPAMRLA